MKYDIKITKTTEPKPKPQNVDSIGFGKVFTDHMFMMDYTPEKGWYDGRIVPFDNIPMHPAATVFHYGAAIFEGMKAYRTAEGRVQLFRPEENVKRLNNSAERLCLPQLDEEGCLDIFDKLVELEKDWVPSVKGASLYIRPFIFGNDPHLGVHAVKQATFVIICCPVGSYFVEGLNPVHIAIETEDVRAVRGGTGYAKCGGNYGASLRAGQKASKKGFSQVLWLDGVERKYIEEVGAMNVMFKIDGEIVTPMLTGSVLPGITRKSCIELLRQQGYKVTERLISAEELIEAAKSGKLEEAWGTGTAAVVSPIGWLFFNGEETTVGGGKIGKLTQELYDTLTDIQWGRIEDKNHWTHKVC